MNNDDDEFCEVVITAPDEVWLLDFTRHLVDIRLAVCGRHTSIRSNYTSDGTIHAQDESRVAPHTPTSASPQSVTPPTPSTPTKSPESWPYPSQPPPRLQAKSFRRHSHTEREPFTGCLVARRPSRPQSLLSTTGGERVAW